jgi:hypoxanthine phosphoribosyltransferase
MELTPNNHKTLISQSEINQRVQQMARQIERDYAHSERLVLVCVLTGARKFFDKLSAALRIPHEKATIQVSSYGVGTYLSDGNVTVKQPLNADVIGADVLVVEDIIDTGYSIQTVLGMVWGAGPRSVCVSALLSKPARRAVDVPVDYLGFAIDDYFVFGFGIDVDEQHRELDYIGYFEM